MIEPKVNRTEVLEMIDTETGNLLNEVERIYDN